MKAILMEQVHSDLNEAIRHLKVVERERPIPKPGQVLVKMEAAPCNPSDLLFLMGLYGVEKTLPTVPGWEGAGTVIENGGGLMGWMLQGKRVACAGQADGDGTWAEYYVAEAKSCVPLSDAVSFDQGATLLINPLTAVGMVEKAQAEGHKAIVQTAALSQVGRMVQTLCRQNSIPLINIVRRQSQVDQLKQSGEKWILNSEDGDFPSKLKSLAKELNATIVFDAIAGSQAGEILDLLPNKSKLLVYGALSGEACSGISPLALIFQDKRVEGFWLSKWIRDGGLLSIMRATKKVQKLIQTESFETTIRKTVSFDEWAEALIEYTQEMSLGKMLLKIR